MPLVKESSTAAARSGDQAEVDYACSAWRGMAEAAALGEDLLGGTPRMREKRTKWLPKHVAEDWPSYDLRLKSTFLFNSYERALHMLAGKVFSEPVKVHNAHPKLAPLIDNIDGAGSTLTEFAEQLFLDCVNWGPSHVFVDYGRPPEGATAAVTDAMRPWWVHVHANRLRAWRDHTEGGQRFLDRCNIHEWSQVPAGEWGEETRHRVRVYYRAGYGGGLSGQYASFRSWEDHDGTWVEVAGAAGDMRPFQSIPLVTAYAQREGYMVGRPALDDLAWKSLEDWQSGSEQRRHLQFARSNVLFGSGFSEEELSRRRQVGAGVFWAVQAPDAKLQHVEVQGSGLEHGWKDRRFLREEQSVLALMPLVERASGADTATARKLDQVQSDTRLQAWSLNIQAALQEAWEHTAVWVGLDPQVTDVGTVEVNTNFGLSHLDAGLLELHYKNAANELISRETYWQILQDRKAMPEDFDPDEELLRLGVLPPDLEEEEDEDGEGEGEVPGAGTEAARAEAERMATG